MYESFGGAILIDQEIRSENRRISRGLDAVGIGLSVFHPTEISQSDLAYLRPRYILMQEGSEIDIPREIDPWKVIIMTPKSSSDPIDYPDDQKRAAQYLDEGADHCQLRPIQPLALAYHLRALKRRSKQKPRQTAIIKDLEIDRVNNALYKRGERVKLGEREQDALSILLKNYGKLTYTGEMSRRMYDDHHRYEDQHIDHVRRAVRRLKRKIEDDINNPTYIHLIRDQGFVFDADLKFEK